MIDIPPPIMRALNILEENSFEGYLVGGCVRDALLGSEPKDFDITTDALPHQTAECFSAYKVIETGIKHGTVTVMIEHTPIEITTYRIDGEYTDNRRPNSVTFSRTIKDDLQRRDFTINAMAYHPSRGLLDYFGGRDDLQNGVIRCVGKPNKRFGEDALRIMRALRFSAVLGFEIDGATAESIHKNRHLLRNISAERIAAELNRLIVGKDASAVLEAYSDVIAVFMPETEPMIGFEQHTKWHVYDVWRHTLKAIASAPADLILRLTMLFHDIGKPSSFSMDDNGAGHFYGHPKISEKICGDIMRRLRYENATASTVAKLVRYHDTPVEDNEKSIKRMLSKLGERDFRLLLNVKRADTMAQNLTYTAERLRHIAAVESVANTVIAEAQCFSIKDLAIGGGDLLALGLCGKQIGDTLNMLLEQVIDGALENERQVLLASVHTIKSGEK